MLLLLTLPFIRLLDFKQVLNGLQLSNATNNDTKIQGTNFVFKCEFNLGLLVDAIWV